MKALLRATAVLKSEKESKDGKNKYYRIGLVQSGDLIEFETTKPVFDEVKMYQDSTFELDLSRGEYKGQIYERKSITAIVK